MLQRRPTAPGPRCLYAASQPRGGDEQATGCPSDQHVALQVHGDSMEPMLHAGDTILVRLGEDVTVGDVIVARRPEDGYVVKRVASRAPGRLVLASLNVAYADVEVPADGRHVVGTVVLRWCAHAAASPLA